MKIVKYSIAFIALFAGLITSCKKETTETQEIGVDSYNASDMEATPIGNENMSDSVSGSGMSNSNNSENNGTNSNTNSTSKNNSSSTENASKSAKNSNDKGVDMTKDTIYTPAGKGGPSGTVGSGRGNSRAKTVGT